MTTLLDIAEKLKRIEVCPACEIEGQQHTCIVRDARWCGRELARHVKSGGWIRCDDRLPERGAMVLFWGSNLRTLYGTAVIRAGHLCEDSEFWRDEATEVGDGLIEYPMASVSHWQPLPEAPEDA